MFEYYLVSGKSKVPLFRSQFAFRTEDYCLHHYEKGVRAGLFVFERSQINTGFVCTGLHGLLGRNSPVDLVRILCAFGWFVEGTDPLGNTWTLTEVFQPVTYFIPVQPGKAKFIRHLFHRRIHPPDDFWIPLFFEQEDRLLIGHCFTYQDQDADVQFPKFCELLERDECLPLGTIRQSLFDLFYEGYRIVAQEEDRSIFLAERDTFEDVLRGYGNEKALLYLGATSETS